MGPPANEPNSRDALVSTNDNSESDLRGKVMRIPSRTACELVDQRSRLYVDAVDVGIGGWEADETPKAALVPASVIRLMELETTSFFAKLSPLSKSQPATV